MSTDNYSNYPEYDDRDDDTGFECSCGLPVDDDGDLCPECLADRADYLVEG